MRRRALMLLISLSQGGVMLGILQGLGGVSYNQLWYQFLLRWLSAIAAFLFGGDTSGLTGSNGTA